MTHGLKCCCSIHDTKMHTLTLQVGQDRKHAWVSQLSCAFCTSKKPAHLLSSASWCYSRYNNDFVCPVLKLCESQICSCLFCVKNRTAASADVSRSSNDSPGSSQVVPVAVSNFGCIDMSGQACRAHQPMFCNRPSIGERLSGTCTLRRELSTCSMLLLNQKDRGIG